MTALKVAELEPAGMLTDAGTVTLVLPLLSLIVNPPVGAGPFRLMVPVEMKPPAIVDGLNEIDFMPTGPTLRFAVRVTPPTAAVMVTLT